MQLVHIDLVHVPDWGWHLHDTEEMAKLTASLHRYGQIQTLLVRELTTCIATDLDTGVRVHGFQGYEIIDGRRRLGGLRSLGKTEVWIHSLGRISKDEAIRYALALELEAEIDYAQLAVQVTGLTEGVDSLPMTTPFTAERIRYFSMLTAFDWSQFSETNEQVDLYQEFEPPPPPVVETVEAAPAAKPKAERAAKPATSALPPQSAASEVAVRLAARAALAAAPIGEQLYVQEAARQIVVDARAAEEIAKLVRHTYAPPITFGEDFAAPAPSDWRPSAPPCLDGITEIELDTETTGLCWWKGDLPIGMSIRLPDGRKQYLPWAHKGGGNLDENVVKEWARRELRGKVITNANMKFDNHMLYAWGIDLEEQGNTLADVQHYAALLDEYRKEFGLSILARDFLGETKTGQELDKTKMAEYHAGQVAEYACHDVHLVGQLRQVMMPLMHAEDLERVRQLECDVIYPVCEMERNAAHVNRDGLREAVIKSAAMLQEMLFEIGREVGFQMNPDKNADWQRLFEYYKLPEPGRTEPSKKFPQGQVSFADALIEKIDHRVVQLARRAGKLASLRSKFLIPYEQVVGDDCKLRFFLHQLRGDEYGTARGRFSMSGASRGTGTIGANLQQVFRVNSQRMAFGFAHNDSSHDDEIFLVRSFFEAERGEYGSSDAQSIEYRLAAHFAEAVQLLEAYQADFEKLERGELTGKWVDFHKVVGDVIRRYKDLDRNIIKNANFCLVYNGQKPTLAATLGLPRAESDQIFNIWHSSFPELSKLPAKAEGLARARGYVKTILGRRARFRDAEELKWAHAAVNYVIQGSAADIMKTKLVELHKERKDTGFVMRQTVHDEVDGDFLTPETAQKVRVILNRQSFPELRVPIVWETETGKNWAVAH